MMDQSNKIIFAILAVTLVITITGTVLNLSKMYNLGYPGLTGAATSTDQGNATITITQQTSITNSFNDIQFGSGYVNDTCTACVMDSNGTRASVGCCGTFNMSNSFGFLLENTGNINLSVNYTCAGNCTAAQFIGGTNPAFQIRVTNNFNAGQSGEVGAQDTVASCAGGINGAGVGGLNITSYISVTTVGDFLCGNSSTNGYVLSFVNTQDAFVVDLNVSVPSDAPIGGGQKITYFTFTGSATG